MKIRASIHLDNQTSAVQLHPVLNETDHHLALKLAACVFFHDVDPLVISSPQQHSALAGQDFAPDLMTVDDTHQVRLWIECDTTTLHKLSKVTNRFRDARLWMLVAQPHEAKQMAANLESDGNKRFEVWSFPQGDFARWKSLIREQTDIIGEANETSMNLVINDEMFVTELVRIR